MKPHHCHRHHLTLPNALHDGNNAWISYARISASGKSVLDIAIQCAPRGLRGQRSTTGLFSDKDIRRCTRQRAKVWHHAGGLGRCSRICSFAMCRYGLMRLEPFRIKYFKAICQIGTVREASVSERGCEGEILSARSKRP